MTEPKKYKTIRIDNGIKRMASSLRKNLKRITNERFGKLSLRKLNIIVKAQ